MAKDETEEGITGLPIPKKKMSSAKRHEFEKKRRSERKKRNDPRVGDSFSQHRMTGSKSHKSEYQNTRSVREEVISYLLDEGFASDEKSAEAIMCAMSEDWKQNIVEGMGLSVGTSKLAGKLLSNPRTSPEKGAKNFQKNVTDPIGHAVKGAAKVVLGVGDKKNKEMMQKRRPN
jgi:phage-related protein